MREPPRSPDPEVTVSRRRLLLLGATASLATACGDAAEGSPPDAGIGDAPLDAPSERADASADAAPERMDAVFERMDVDPSRTIAATTRTPAA